MKKRMIAMLLALVLCFGLLSMAAAADDVGAKDNNGFSFSFDMFKKSFELPDTISQLLDMFQLNGVWNLIKNIINAVRGIDQIF